MARRLFWFGVVAFVITAVSFVYGFSDGLLARQWWYDIVQHFLGGVLAGLIGAWYAPAFLGRTPRISDFVLGAVVLGIGVEGAEYVTGFGRSPFMSYELDTAKDMAVDVIGGLLVGLSYRMGR